jgi:hypothetical protein
MGRFYTYRPPWRRIQRKLRLWKRFVAPGHGIHAGDGEAFLGPSVRAYSFAGPAVDTIGTIGVAVGTRSSVGPAADASAAIHPAVRAATFVGPDDDS